MMGGNKGSRAKGTGGQFVSVANLAFSVNEQDLTDFFKKQGFNPLRARLLYDDQGNSRGTGFVEMHTEADVAEAVAKVNQQKLQGRAIEVSQAKK